MPNDHGQQPRLSSSVAKRVRAELQRLAGFDRNKPIYRGWADAWGLQSPEPEQPVLVSPEVARRLTLLGKALDELEQQLALQYPNLSPSTTTHQIHRFRLILARSIESLGSPWGNVQPELTPDLMQCLSFWDELLAATEPTPESAELRDLLKAIVEARLAASQLADSRLRAAILSILAELEAAIFDFQVGGPAAFNKSFRQAVTELFEHEDLIRDNLEAEEVSKLREVWSKFEQVCAPLIFADTLLTAGSRLKQIGATVYKLLGGG